MGDYSKVAPQADFAGRIGKIAKTSKDDIYEATLHICLLHTLLTSCKEVLDHLKAHKRAEATTLLPQQGTYWGLNASMVQTTFKNEPLSVATVVRHMRHAVSHPAPWSVLSQNCDTKYPSTGFYRSKVEDEQIAAFAFIDSPDVENGEIRGYDTEKQAEYKLRKRFDRNHPEHQKTDFPVDACVYLSDDNKYYIYHEDELYARFFKIDIPIENLQEFVQELSCFLYEQFGSHTSGTPWIDYRKMEGEGRNGSDQQNAHRR